MTSNCENPQLRNAQLPDKAVNFAHAPILIFPVRGCSRMRSHITVCIRFILNINLLPLKVDVLGHYLPEKIQKTN